MNCVGRPTADAAALLLEEHGAAPAHLGLRQRHCRHCGKVLEYRRRQPLGRRGKTRMSLLVVYVVLMITGDFVAYLIGLVIERNVPAASLPAFLAMYFLFLWVA